MSNSIINNLIKKFIGSSDKNKNCYTLNSEDKLLIDGIRKKSSLTYQIRDSQASQIHVEVLNMLDFRAFS